MQAVTSFSLTPIPFFVLMGEVLFHSGVALKAIDAFSLLIRRVPGERPAPDGVRHAAGERLWSAGDDAGWSIVVVAGCVTATDSHAGQLRFGAGAMAGALESMAGRQRRFAAVAETAVIGVRVDGGTLLDILEDHTDMALGLLHSLSRDVLALRWA